MFSFLEIRKRKSRSHGIRKKGNGKRKKRAVKRSNTSFKDLSKVLEDHGRHSMLVTHRCTVARTVMCRQDGRGRFPVSLDDHSKCRTNSRRKSQLS